MKYLETKHERNAARITTLISIILLLFSFTIINLWLIIKSYEIIIEYYKFTISLHIVNIYIILKQLNTFLLF